MRVEPANQTADHEMSKDTDKAARAGADDGSPKFGRLLLVLLGAVVFCVLLTWLMGTFFPDFPNF
jgi:hypothetical protein